MAVQVPPVQLSRRLFTADEFQRMAEAGIFSEDERLELIEGEIIQMTPIGPRHAWCLKRVVRLFTRLVPWAIPSVQDPARLSERSQPQPDFALVRPEAPQDVHPAPRDLLLVVEVADTTVAYDRNVKGPIFARAGLPEYWLIDLQADRIELYWDPSPSGYQSMHRAERGQQIRSRTIEGLVVEVDEILG